MRDLSQNKEAAVELEGKSESASKPQEEERAYENVEDNVYSEIEPENGDYPHPSPSVVVRNDDFPQKASSEQGHYERNYDGSSCKTTTLGNHYE